MGHQKDLQTQNNENVRFISCNIRSTIFMVLVFALVLGLVFQNVFIAIISAFFCAIVWYRRYIVSDAGVSFSFLFRTNRLIKWEEIERVCTPIDIPVMRSLPFRLFGSVSTIHFYIKGKKRPLGVELLLKDKRLVNLIEVLKIFNEKGVACSYRTKNQNEFKKLLVGAGVTLHSNVHGNATK